MDIDYTRAAFPRDTAMQALRLAYDQLIGVADLLEVVIETGDHAAWGDQQTLSLHTLASKVDGATRTLQRLDVERAQAQAAVENGTDILRTLRLLPPANGDRP